MTHTPIWRKTYDIAERAAAPHAEKLVRSGEFAKLTATVIGVRCALGHSLDRVTALPWHLVNLPAQTDVQRVRMQIGALDREVRRLSLQLEKSGAGHERNEGQ